jgi:hypothetical protein
MSEGVVVPFVPRRSKIVPFAPPRQADLEDRRGMGVRRDAQPYPLPEWWEPPDKPAA